MAVLDALSSDQTARITRQAGEWTFPRVLTAAARAVLSVVAWLLVGLGRCSYWLVAALWLAFTWSAAAVKVGWEDAHPGRVEADD